MNLSNQSYWNRNKLQLILNSMKNNTEVFTILANLTEMILQSRISRTPKHLHRIQSIRSEIEVARQHQHPSDQLLYFLIDRHQYQIKNKLIAINRKKQCQFITINIQFTIFNKDTSVAETAEIWKITVNRRSANVLQKSDCLHEIIHLLGQILQQLTSSYIFNELYKSKEASRKYIIDFKMDIVSDQQKSNQTGLVYSMWNCRARMNQVYEIDCCCYWKPKLSLPYFSSSEGTQTQRKRNASLETEVDSVTSIKESNIRKYWSIEEKQQAFEFYDTQLDLTIISSSDSDSPSNSYIIRPLSMASVDQFELLIEETNEEEAFMIQNHNHFQNWEQLINFNFHY